VRCRPPNGLSRIYRASGLAFWRYSNPRFDARLSETRWDGDTSYPHSTGCCGTSSRIFPSTASADALSRASLNSSTGSSEPPKCNACWPARKPSRPTRCAQASFRFHSSRRFAGCQTTRRVSSCEFSERFSENSVTRVTTPCVHGRRIVWAPTRRSRTGSTSPESGHAPGRPPEPRCPTAAQSGRRSPRSAPYPSLSST
jgi:hypothetical protein